MTAEQILNAIYPSSITDTNTVTFLGLAELRTAQDGWGDKRPMAVAYRAAHMMVLSSRQNGAAGAIASYSEGGMSVSFANGQSQNSTDLDQTSFGLELKSLIKNNFITIDVNGRNPRRAGQIPGLW